MMNVLILLKGEVPHTSALSWLQLIAATASGAIVSSYDSDEPVVEHHEDEDNDSAQDGAERDDDVAAGTDVEEYSLEEEEDGDKYLDAIGGVIVDDKLFKDNEEDKVEYFSYYRVSIEGSPGWSLKSGGPAKPDTSAVTT